MSLAFPTPPPPEVPAEQIASASWQPRYEDVAQDGRLTVLALPPATGVVWRTLLGGKPWARAANKQGIIPILTRLSVFATENFVRLDRPLTGHGRFALARGETDGAVDRLFMNIWVAVDGISGRIVPPTPAGDPVPAGGVFAEHVFTRPFAPRDQRKVLRLDLEGLAPVPELVHPAQAPATTGDAPPGATWLEEAPVADPAWTVFGLDHTDSNQHVNSLVYIRMVTEAALRRLDAHGRRGKLLVRGVELAYRKPSFAGDKLRVSLRAFTTPDGVGAAGTLVSDGEPDVARAFARVLFAAA
jgi:hypothetical protein